MCVYLYICVGLCVGVRVCVVRVCVCICLRARLCVHVCRRKCVYVCMCSCLFFCMHERMYVCMYHCVSFISWPGRLDGPAAQLRQRGFGLALGPTQLSCLCLCRTGTSASDSQGPPSPPSSASPLLCITSRSLRDCCVVDTNSAHYFRDPLQVHFEPWVLFAETSCCRPWRGRPRWQAKLGRTSWRERLKPPFRALVV